MNSHISLIQNIDALLPQTQCGLCGHRDGCLPYAQAISEGEAANKCDRWVGTAFIETLMYFEQ
jgi:Na+-translocating ferredoxin:NAD+ oxidoreductase subunit B